jgi:hypothetical protein
LPQINTDETQIGMLEFDPPNEKTFLHKETTEKIIGAAFEVPDATGRGLAGPKAMISCHGLTRMKHR